MKKSIMIASGFSLMLLLASCADSSNKSNTNTKIADSTSVKAIYICPMDSDVQSDKPGECPKCGMTLEKK